MPPLTQEKVDNAVNRYPGNISVHMAQSNVSRQGHRWRRYPTRSLTPNHSRTKAVKEKALAAHAVVLAICSVLLRMEGVEKGTRDQI